MTNQTYPTTTAASTLGVHHYLFLKWNESLNASGLFREAIEARMRRQEIDVESAAQVVQSAVNDGYDRETIQTDFNSFDSLKEVTDDD